MTPTFDRRTKVRQKNELTFYLILLYNLNLTHQKWIFIATKKVYHTVGILLYDFKNCCCSVCSLVDSCVKFNIYTDERM